MRKHIKYSAAAATTMLILGCGCDTNKSTTKPGPKAANSVTLNWTVSTSPDITSQKICRAIAAGASCATPIATLDNNTVNTYQDTSVPPGTYYYTIEACTGAVCSLPSNEATATIAVTPPPAPTNLTAVVQ